MSYKHILICRLLLHLFFCLQDFYLYNPPQSGPGSECSRCSSVCSSAIQWIRHSVGLRQRSKCYMARPQGAHIVQASFFMLTDA